METTFQATFMPVRMLLCTIYTDFCLPSLIGLKFPFAQIYRKTNNETPKPYTTNTHTVIRSFTHSDSDLT